MKRLRGPQVKIGDLAAQVGSEHTELGTAGHGRGQPPYVDVQRYGQAGPADDAG